RGSSCGGPWRGSPWPCSSSPTSSCPGSRQSDRSSRRGGHLQRGLGVPLGAGLRVRGPAGAQQGRAGHGGHAHEHHLPVRGLQQRAQRRGHRRDGPHHLRLLLRALWGRGGDRE
ncbi:unnamed protein product, partial [Heterosigma akashiwo]